MLLAVCMPQYANILSIILSTANYHEGRNFRGKEILWVAGPKKSNENFSTTSNYRATRNSRIA